MVPHPIEGTATSPCPPCNWDSPVSYYSCPRSWLSSLSPCLHFCSIIWQTLSKHTSCSISCSCFLFCCLWGWGTACSPAHPGPALLHSRSINSSAAEGSDSLSGNSVLQKAHGIWALNWASTPLSSPSQGWKHSTGSLESGRMLQLMGQRMPRRPRECWQRSSAARQTARQGCRTPPSGVHLGTKRLQMSRRRCW